MGVQSAQFHHAATASRLGNRLTHAQILQAVVHTDPRLNTPGNQIHKMVHLQDQRIFAADIHHGLLKRQHP